MSWLALVAGWQIASSPVQDVAPPPCLQAVAAEAEGLDPLARSLYALCRDQVGPDSSTWSALSVNAALVDARLGQADAHDQIGTLAAQHPTGAAGYAVALSLAYAGEYEDGLKQSLAIAAVAVSPAIKGLANTLAMELSLAMGRCTGPVFSVSEVIAPALGAQAFAHWCRGEVEAARLAFQAATAANPGDRVIETADVIFSEQRVRDVELEPARSPCAVPFEAARPTVALSADRVANVYRCLYRAP